MAFAMPAWSADAKFSGSYYVVGYFEDNHTLKDYAGRTAAKYGSTASFFAQRLRIQPEFKIVEGLTLVTRFDALEKKWGDQTWSPSPAYDVTNRASTGASSIRTQENIEWERAYVDFTTGIGRFMVGYQNFVAWGTSFGDTHITRPGIKYMLPMGDLTLVAAWEKVGEGSSTMPAGTNKYSEKDYNVYDLGVIGKFKGGEWGVLVQYGHNTFYKDGGYAAPTSATLSSDSFTRRVWLVDPYVKATFGPVYIEAEGAYAWGDWYDYSLATTKDIDVTAMGIYVNAKVDLAPAYVGLKFAWVRGDDYTTTDKVEGNIMAALLAGQVFNPCLMMWNDDLNSYLSSYAGWVSSTGKNTIGLATEPQSNFFDNAWLYQIYGGFKFTPKLELYASVTYAQADEKLAENWAARDYGTELDVTLTYKIFDNLSYMIGAGYWWVGDYFKGTSATNKIDDTYLLMHKLTLTF
jgi:hypothetical protein